MKLPDSAFGFSELLKVMHIYKCIGETMRRNKQDARSASDIFFLSYIFEYFDYYFLEILQ